MPENAPGTTNESLIAVLRERARQEVLWGEQNHDPFTYQAILQEETGEAARAALELRFGKGTLEHLREEAVQVAAVALAIVECLDRGKWRWADGTPKPGEKQ